MFDRRLFLLVATGALVFAGTVVSPAAEHATLTHEGFEAAQKVGGRSWFTLRLPGARRAGRKTQFLVG